MSIIDVNQEKASFSDHVTKMLEEYFGNLGGQVPSNIYNMVLEQVEVPLLEKIMQFTRNNQSKAANILGISRGTLRTKLKRYFGDRYVGTRD